MSENRYHKAEILFLRDLKTGLDQRVEKIQSQLGRRQLARDSHWTDGKLLCQLQISKLQQLLGKLKPSRELI
jgi:hypothetical protein